MPSQSLHRIERRRADALKARQQDQALEAKDASLKAQQTLDTVKALSQNQGLIRKVKFQARKIAELGSHLETKDLQIEQGKNELETALQEVQSKSKLDMEATRTKCEEEKEKWKNEIQIERAARKGVEEQLAAERANAQALLVSFGEVQTEAQWKRKLNQLRSEHKQLQMERDHYKRLCQAT